jgi:hypothetical protein
VGDATRRASLFWPRRKSRHIPHSGLGNHTALGSQESIDVVPLDDITDSPTHRQAHRTGKLSDDPFANHSTPLSPFADSQQQTAVMSPSSDHSPSIQSERTASDSTVSHDRPVLMASSSSISRPPPPKPLGLPPPRTPPPINVPPQLVLSPVVTHIDPEDHIKEVRWWHDWLCGCGEGTDRGGDNQVKTFCIASF